MVAFSGGFGHATTFPEPRRRGTYARKCMSALAVTPKISAKVIALGVQYPQYVPMM
jgi:hypothetical protein